MARIALLAFLVLSGVAATSSGAKSESLQSILCLYKGESYTEGAYLYPSRLLLLTCTVDGGRPLWKVVPTTKLSDLRLNGSNPDSGIPSEPSAAQTGLTSISPESRDHKKCFAFSGKRYCE